MVEFSPKIKFFFVFTCLTCLIKDSKSQSYEGSEDDWDIQSNDLTEEIKKITQRPDTYVRTPAGLHHFTEITDPEEYYENEYADKPCQDKGEGKILARKHGRRLQNRRRPKEEIIQLKENIPKEVVDTLKVSNDNGKYKVQEEFVTANMDADNNDDKDNEKEIEKKIPIGDNIETNKNNKEVDENEEEADKNIPIGDNLNFNEGEQKQQEIVAQNNENEPQVNMKDIVNDVKKEVIDEHKKEPGKKLADIVKDLRSGPDVRKLYNIVEDSNDKVANIGKVSINENDAHDIIGKQDVEKHANNKAEQKVLNRKMDLAFVGKLFDQLYGVNEKKRNEKGLRSLIGNNPMKDFQIKIKLESVDNQKKDFNNLLDMARKPLNGMNSLNSLLDMAQKPLNGMNSINNLLDNMARDPLNGMNSINNLLDMARKPLDGMNQMQNIVDKLMPSLGQNGFGSKNLLNSNNMEPRNFYMKYLQIDPDQHKLRYEYYFFQQYVNNRYNRNGENPSQVQLPSPSLLINKLINQMMNPMSLLSNPILSLLQPVHYNTNSDDNGRKLPKKIFINEKSVAKYKRSLNHIEPVGADERKDRAKRDVAAPSTTEQVFFNEGPFKVSDEKALAWAKDFLQNDFPKEERPSTYLVIHQQPSSTCPYQWYHPFPDHEATFYTIEPTVTRTRGPGEPEDLCKCQHWHRYSTTTKPPSP